MSEWHFCRLGPQCSLRGSRARVLDDAKESLVDKSHIAATNRLPEDVIAEDRSVFELRMRNLVT
jgi:hypothetical protein